MNIYPHLLRPLERGRRRLRNRVVFPGHQTLFSDGGVVGDRMLAYYRERARGGVGAVIVEGAAVHPTTVKFPQYLLAHDPSIVPSLTRLADALHAHDTRVFLQLAHSGSRMSSQDARTPLWSPSALRSANSPEIPHAMTPADIAELLDGYEAAARNVAASAAAGDGVGIDGVEIHAAHEYLLSAFLSPLSNRRDDEYGGSLENRCRLAVEVVRRVRSVLPDRVVGIRLNGSDLVEGGLGPDDCAAVAAHITGAADLDYVHVSAGRSSHNQAIVPPMDVPHGVYASLAAGIRPCIGCNQGCYGNLVLVRPISCTVNPAVGREDELGVGTETPVTVPRRIVVVGGGPAGMEAALVAARRGHAVVLLEASDRLGGQVRLGAAVDARRELADIVDFQAAELERLGVEVRLSTRADAALVASVGADDVVVAVGSTPQALELPTDGSVRVVTPHDRPDGDGPVVVIDDVGHFPAYVPAERWPDVTLVTSRFAPGWALDPTTAGTMLARLRDKGVRFALHSAPLRIEEGAVGVRDTLSGEERRLPAAVVVAAVGNDARDELEGHRIGDCLAPRTVLEAIREGHLLGRRL